MMSIMSSHYSPFMLGISILDLIAWLVLGSPLILKKLELIRRPSSWTPIYLSKSSWPWVMAWIQSEVYKASEPSKVRFFWASLSPIWCSGLMESTSSVLTKLGRGDGDISGTAHLYWPIWSPSGRFPGKHGWPSSWAYKALASRIQLASMLLSGLARKKNPKTGRNFNITVFELAQIRKHTSFLKMIVILFFFVWPNSSL